MRVTIVLVCAAIWCCSGTDAWVSGHPCTESSSFTPIGTPPNGRDTSAAIAEASACSRSRKQNALSELASMAA